MAKSELIQVGEIITKINATTDILTLSHITSLTMLEVLEILDLPPTRVEQIKLLRSTKDKYDELNRKDVTLFTGDNLADNLADNQDVAPRVDKTKVYVLERIT